jgi:hypothetical protein
VNIHLKIINHILEEHSVIFRYYTDIIDEEFLAVHDGMGNINRLQDGSPARCTTDVNINIFDTTISSEDDVKNYIIKNCPPNITWFELKEALHKKELESSKQVLSSMEGKTFTFTKEELTINTNQVDIEKLLDQLLADTTNSSNNNP